MSNGQKFFFYKFYEVVKRNTSKLSMSNSLLEDVLIMIIAHSQLSVVCLFFVTEHSYADH